jgi:hypothetical protein
MYIKELAKFGEKIKDKGISTQASRLWKSHETRTKREILAEEWSVNSKIYNQHAACCCR